MKTKLTDQECIQEVAKDCDWEQPQWYISQVQKRFGRKITNSSVTKAIGPRSARLGFENTKHIKVYAQKYLEACRQDIYLATAMLRRVYRES
jgi:hypothetical protein